MNTVAIVQSNYIPWKGYFDMIAAVDHFILFDDVQYTRRDWRNRNRIRTPTGPQWLTVPVETRGHYTQPIREVRINGHDWIDRHLRTLAANYARAPHFDAVMAWIEPVYRREHDLLSGLNRDLIVAICANLGITTPISASSDYRIVDGRSERLLDLCVQSGATRYLSGPAARDYLDVGLFADAGIAVAWFDYAGYPEYPQSWGGFDHHVTILDLLFHCGPDARRQMRF